MSNLGKNDKPSELYKLDDFNIKQSKDAEGNALDGKYDLTMKYGGQEVTKQIGEDDFYKLAYADHDEKIHILGSLATGNPDMFTNQNHDEIAGKITSDYLKIIGDEQDRLERAGFKKMSLSDFSQKKGDDPAKDIVTGQNLDSLKIGIQPVINGRKHVDDYSVTIQYGGTQKLTTFIDQKTFDKLQLVNDYQRTKMFGKLFPEVDFRFSSEEQKNVGQMILDETRSAGNEMEQEKDKALEQARQRNQAIGMAASSLFESMSQDDNSQSQSVSRGMGL